MTGVSMHYCIKGCLPKTGLKKRLQGPHREFDGAETETKHTDQKIKYHTISPSGTITGQQQHFAKRDLRCTVRTKYRSEGLIFRIQNVRRRLPPLWTSSSTAPSVRPWLAERATGVADDLISRVPNNVLSKRDLAVDA